MPAGDGFNKLEWQTASNRKRREIGPLPKVVDAHRRDACTLDLKLFAETYFANVFHLGWASFHLELINRLQDTCLNGGTYALACPRGSGKTSLSWVAATWALLYGHRSYVAIIAATQDRAKGLLKTIRETLESNPTLLEDFPEACFPFSKLEGVAQKAGNQLLNDKPTSIGLSTERLVFPTVEGSPSSGSVVQAAGLTGNIRGMQTLRHGDGAIVRPDFVILDDPQTDEAAASPMQTQTRLGLVNGAILGLKGPGSNLGAVCPCTVIAKNDLADQLLDRDKKPEWRGHRVKLLESEPTNVKLWETYAELRAESLRTVEDISLASKFYHDNRAEMDAGAVVSWPDRFDPSDDPASPFKGELSGIQHAINLRLNDDVSFAAEYQNEPLSYSTDNPLMIRPDHVQAKVIDVAEGLVPQWATRLVAFVDVQANSLWYVLAAFGNGFKGHVVRYGVFPGQEKLVFGRYDVDPSLETLYPDESQEGRWYAALDALTKHLADEEYLLQDGQPIALSRIIVDANYGPSTTTIRQFARDSKHRSLILTSHGQGITADRRPLNDYREVPGERTGWNWRLVQKPFPHLLYDTNSYKSFVAQRIHELSGGTSSLGIFKGSEHRHKMLAQHLTAEYPTPTQGRGRTVNVWRLIPNRDNDWLDCLVGCFVAASEQGISFVGHELNRNKLESEPKKPIRKYRRSTLKI